MQTPSSPKEHAACASVEMDPKPSGLGFPKPASLSPFSTHITTIKSLPATHLDLIRNPDNSYILQEDGQLRLITNPGYPFAHFIYPTLNKRFVMFPRCHANRHNLLALSFQPSAYVFRSLSSSGVSIFEKASKAFVSEQFLKKYLYSTAYPPPTAEPKIEIELLAERPVLPVPDEEIYESFKGYMNTMRGYHSNAPYIGKTLKVGPIIAKDLANGLLARVQKKHLTETPIAVGLLPKIGNLTSSGSIRNIYPMSLSLQKYQERMFYGKKPDVPYNVVYGPKFPNFQYTYDVTSMDREIYPYIYRYAAELNLLDIFLPPVIWNNKTGFIQQFPSGLYCTSLVATCFVSAILDKAKAIPLSTHIQGDGVMSEFPIDHPLLRREKDYEVNGFLYSGRTPVYANALKRLNAPRLVNRENREQFKRQLREAIYFVVLNAREYDDEHRKHFQESTNWLLKLKARDISRIATKEGICRRKIRYYEGYQSRDDLTVSGWDSAWTEVQVVESQPLFIPEEIVSAIW